jgi:hypothetical protein
MRATKLMIGIFAVILFAFVVISFHVSNTSSAAVRLSAQPQTSNVLIADGGDPVPRPWYASAA